MNILGPYQILNSATGPTNQIGYTLSVPVLVGTNGLVEFLNYSSYILMVSFQSMGQVFLQAKSKAIFRSVKNVQGQQTLTVTAVATTVEPSWYQLLFVNVYEDGEAQEYPSTSLDNAPVVAFPSIPTLNFSDFKQGMFYSSFPACQAGGVSNFQIPVGRRLFLFGFDYSLEPTTTGSTSGQVEISNVDTIIGGNQFMQYAVWATTTQAQGQSIRFPFPVPSKIGDGTITLDVFLPALTNTIADATIWLMFL